MISSQTSSAHRSTSRIVVIAAALAMIAAFVPPDLSLTSSDEPASRATIGAELAEHLRVAPEDERIEVIVSFHERDDLPLLERVDAPMRALRALPMAGAYLTPSEIAEVASWPEVRGVHGNIELEYFNHQSVPMSGAPEAWELGYTGEGVTVAIHDTGIDGTHPDLSYPDKTIQNIKILHTRFVDFVHGLDNPTPTAIVEDQIHTDTTIGHGTHVAGSAAGSGDHDPAYRGMAPDASVVGIGAGDVLFVYAALEGYDWLFVEDDDGVPNHERYDIRVINNSWGTTNNLELDPDNPIVQAIFAAYEAGITPVFSAGNSGPRPDTLNFYAQAPWVIGVGAFDKDLEIAGFSSKGYPNHPFKTPDVSAIGVSVESANYTAWPVLPYASASGTSMSAPHVSGLVALILDANPDLSPDQVQDIVRETTIPLDGYETWEAGTGFIDAAAAVRAAETTDGELDAFLAGETAHTIDATRAMLDPEDDAYALPYVRDEEAWEGSVGPALLWAGVNDEREFTVPEGTEFINARIAWDRSPETLDLFLIDPDGGQHSATSDELDYALGSSKILRIRNPIPGEWTVEVRGEVSVATDYAGLIANYVTDESNWADGGEEPTAEISPDSFFKFTPYALGIASTYFMTGESGFHTFHVLDSDGSVVDDAEVDLIMIDRTGEEAFRQRATQRDDGRYQVSDIAFDHTWEGEPGRYRVTFDHISGIEEEVTVRDGAFYLNHLDITAAAVDGDGLQQSTVEPGETITIEGDLERVNERVAVIRFEPVTGADVTASLLDGDGGTLDEVTVTSDLVDGTFTAELTVPEDATSLSGVALESAYDELAFVVGPGYWYGTTQIALELDGAEEIATGVSLEVDPDTVHGSQRTVEITAGATHGGGTDAIEQLELVLRGSNGRTIETWDRDAFTEIEDGVLRLEDAYRLRGPAPWEFHLVMVDSDGESYDVARTVRRGNGGPE